MIPVLVDGVKKYLLTEEEVDAKISASSGGSSSEIRPYSLFIFPTNMTESNFPTGDEYKNCYALRVIDTGGLGWYALILKYESDISKWLSTGLTLDGNKEAE